MMLIPSFQMASEILWSMMMLVLQSMRLMSTLLKPSITWSKTIWLKRWLMRDKHLNHPNVHSLIPVFWLFCISPMIKSKWFSIFFGFASFIIFKRQTKRRFTMDLIENCALKCDLFAGMPFTFHYFCQSCYPSCCHLPAFLSISKRSETKSRLTK